MFRPKSILSAEGVKTHSKSPFIKNSAFENLLKFWELTYSCSSGSKTDFVWLTAGQLFTWNSNTFELEKHCK